MISKRQSGRDIMAMVWLEDLVPKEHLLRKIDAAVDFDKLYEMVEDLYSEDKGRPSIDPVVLVKMVLMELMEQMVIAQQSVKMEIGGLAIPILVYLQLELLAKMEQMAKHLLLAKTGIGG